ncbi:uracil-DNA glycosylase [Marinilabiliaceae bacterium JC017]|nr:uracil-DNA glycosylase [Marinilabiliaceae bacterium JC017]
MNPQIEASWKEVLADEFNKAYFPILKRFLIEEKKRFKIYPPGPLIFNAFANTPFDKVKVVILGQDPYHGQGQAHGLCFSVPDGVTAPPSLDNIFQEIKNDVGASMPSSGNLSRWAQQGVLLLNATLTVRAAQAGSHQGKGWEAFTDEVIKKLSAQRENLVFLLWGRYAQNKSVLIDQKKHCVLKAPHPSPYSADRGFFGCCHFSKANKYLEAHGCDPIQW